MRVSESEVVRGKDSQEQVFADVGRELQAVTGLIVIYDWQLVKNITKK